MTEPKTVKLADYKACAAQIAQDASEGVQTRVVNDEGRTVMIVGTSKERRFESTFDLEALLAEHDPDEPVPNSDWFD